MVTCSLPPLSFLARLGEDVAHEHVLHGGMSCQLPALWLVSVVRVLPALWSCWLVQKLSFGRYLTTSQRMSQKVAHISHQETEGTFVWLKGLIGQGRLALPACKRPLMLVLRGSGLSKSIADLDNRNKTWQRPHGTAEGVVQNLQHFTCLLTWYSWQGPFSWAYGEFQQETEGHHWLLIRLCCHSVVTCCSSLSIKIQALGKQAAIQHTFAWE